MVKQVVFADVMELADVADSKSAGSDTVPVRLQPSAPSFDAALKSGIKYLF